MEKWESKERNERSHRQTQNRKCTILNGNSRVSKEGTATQHDVQQTDKHNIQYTNSDSNSSINNTKIKKQIDSHLRPSARPLSAPPAPSSLKPSISLHRSFAPAVVTLRLLAHHEEVLDARGRVEVRCGRPGGACERVVSKVRWLAVSTWEMKHGGQRKQ